MYDVCCAQFLAFRPFTLLTAANGIKGTNGEYSAQYLVNKVKRKTKGEATLLSILQYTQVIGVF
jgi:hypothetical protein